jgi:Ribosomal protein L10
VWRCFNRAILLRTNPDVNLPLTSLYLNFENAVPNNCILPLGPLLDITQNEKEEEPFPLAITPRSRLWLNRWIALRLSSVQSFLIYIYCIFLKQEEHSTSHSFIMPLSAERKKEYFGKMKALLTDYSKAFIVEVDNVGSKQLQMTRIGLRHKAEVLMGKNTMMRKCIREFVEENPGTPVEKLIETCRGNVGFVFTNGDLGEIREVLESNTRPAPARVGVSILLFFFCY